MTAPKPAVFLDRDGTLNVDKHYLYRLSDWEWIPGAIEAIQLINRQGFLAIVVTNQAGVARQLYDAEAVTTLHRQVNDLLKIHDAWIDAFYFCPHHPDYGEKISCSCRKPNPGMLLAAQQDFDIDLHQSAMIGDKAIDVTTAINAAVTPYLVLTGYGQQDQHKIHASGIIQADVLQAVKHFFKL